MDQKGALQLTNIHGFLTESFLTPWCLLFVFKHSVFKRGCCGFAYTFTECFRVLGKSCSTNVKPVLTSSYFSISLSPFGSWKLCCVFSWESQHQQQRQQHLGQPWERRIHPLVWDHWQDETSELLLFSELTNRWVQTLLPFLWHCLSSRTCFRGKFGSQLLLDLTPAEFLLAVEMLISSVYFLEEVMMIQLSRAERFWDCNSWAPVAV